MLNKSFNHSICYVNGKVYSVGGCDYSSALFENNQLSYRYSCSTEIFDLEKNEWSAGPDCLIAKTGVTNVVVADRYIYQFGDKSGMRNELIS